MVDNRFNARMNEKQQEIYEWLKIQGLNTDDNTLSYWSRTYDVQRIRDVVNFAHKRRSEGQNIKNIGGWVHNLLKTDVPIINNESEANKKFAEDFMRSNKWSDLRIYEKYVKDDITGDDLPLTIKENDFRRSLEALYEKSSIYKDIPSYRNS